MYVTLSVIRDQTGEQFFAVDSIRLGKRKPVGIAKTILKNNVLISDLVEAIGVEYIKEAMKNKD